MRQAAFLAFAEPRFTTWRLTDEVKAEYLVEEHEKSLVSTLKDEDNVRPLEPRWRLWGRRCTEDST